jgi:hypothetical protein
LPRIYTLTSGQIEVKMADVSVKALGYDWRVLGYLSTYLKTPNPYIGRHCRALR